MSTSDNFTASSVRPSSVATRAYSAGVTSSVAENFALTTTKSGSAVHAKSWMSACAYVYVLVPLALARSPVRSPVAPTT